jgi:hypothetical protein
MQQLASRVNFATLDSSQGGSCEVQWGSFHLWVPVPNQATEGQEHTDEKWQELLRLDEWHLSFPRTSGELSQRLIAEGDSARLHVPFGFMVSNMIQSLSLTGKIILHLRKTISAGRYAVMSPPVAESAKLVPNITIRVLRLSVEIADDPFECRLSLIWRAGLNAAKHRVDREEAFRAKVAAILAAESPSASPQARLDSDYRFDPGHSVTVEEARQRLHQVHYFDWNLRHTDLKTKRSNAEQVAARNICPGVLRMAEGVANLVDVTPLDPAPPLFRLIVHGLVIDARKPSFPLEALSIFMSSLGGGLPPDPLFSLLLPLHLEVTLMSLRACLRDYPMPLLDIPRDSSANGPSFHFVSDLVIAEEMGTDDSVHWINCDIAAPFSIQVPKSIMPLKTYANPTIRITTTGVTSFAWAVSIAPAIQDLMRIIETFSSSPLDPSPPLGFWDKVCDMLLLEENKSISPNSDSFGFPLENQGII